MQICEIYWLQSLHNFQFGSSVIKVLWNSRIPHWSTKFSAIGTIFIYGKTISAHRKMALLPSHSTVHDGRFTANHKNRGKILSLNHKPKTTLVQLLTIAVIMQVKILAFRIAWNGCCLTGSTHPLPQSNPFRSFIAHLKSFLNLVSHDRINISVIKIKQVPNFSEVLLLLI